MIKLRANPRFAEYRDMLAAKPEILQPWSGTLFRFQTVDFPAPEDVLSGAGAKHRGGRWNPPGVATLYGSTTDATALEESKANDRYAGIVNRSPRLLVAVEARLTRVLDVTSAPVRRALGVTLTELTAEDWRKLVESGRESFTDGILSTTQKGTTSEDALAEIGWETLPRLDLLQINPEPQRRFLLRSMAWAVSRAGRISSGILLAFVWFAFVAQIFISEFITIIL